VSILESQKNDKNLACMLLPYC